MSYYLAQKDIENLRPIIRKLIGKDQVIFDTPTPDRLKSLLRNAISGKYFPELQGKWRLKQKGNSIIVTRVDSIAVVDQDTYYHEEPITIEEILEILATTFNQVYYFIEVPSNQDLTQLPTTFEVEYDELLGSLRLTRK